MNVAGRIFFLCLWYENTKIISRHKKPVCRIVVYKSLSLSWVFVPPLPFTSGIKQPLCIDRFRFSPSWGGWRQLFRLSGGPCMVYGVRRQLLPNKYRNQRKAVRDSIV